MNAPQDHSPSTGPDAPDPNAPSPPSPPPDLNQVPSFIAALQRRKQAMRGARRCGLTMRDEPGANPLVSCFRKPGQAVDVLLCLPEENRRIHEIPSTLTCLAVEPGPVQDAGELAADDDLVVPEDVVFELNLAELPEQLSAAGTWRLGTGVNDRLPAGRFEPSAVSCDWPFLKSRLQPSESSVRAIKATTLSGKGYRLAARSRESFRIETKSACGAVLACVEAKRGGWQLTVEISKAVAAPFTAELTFQTPAGQRTDCYVFSPPRDRQNQSSRERLVPRRLRFPPIVTSTSARLSVRPLRAGDVCLMHDAEQVQRWFPDPPLAAVTVHQLSDTRYHLTLSDADLAALAAFGSAESSALFLRRMPQNGGAA